VEYLLSRGASVDIQCQDGNDAFYYTTVGTPSKPGDVGIMEMLAKYAGNGDSARGKEIVKKRKYGRTFGLIHFAAVTGSNEVLEWLVKEVGVDVNSKTDDGLTAVHLAVSRGKASCIKI
jgi:hypothetical protein